MRNPTHYITEPDDDARTATCSICGLTKIKVERRPDGSVRKRQCRAVINRNRRKNPGSRRPQRGRQLKWRYGISLEQWDALLIAQSGRCAICIEPMMDPHLDHDHGDGRVRGLLCSSCNLGLGNFRDDPDRLRRAAAYLIP